MRLRAKAVTLVTAAAGFLVPLTATAEAVTTTSTIVAYTADTNGNGIAELYTRPADGSGSPTRVFTNTVDVWLPSLSPDGTKIAYLLNDTSAYGVPIYRLYVRTLGVGGHTLVLNNNVVSSVAWSADGTKLVASAYDFVTQTWGTYVVDADGTGSPQLVPTTDEKYGEEPSFSPSGQQVAVDAFNEQFEYVGIDLISLTSGKRTRITGTTGGSDPVWSPDGQYILFQRYLPTCGVGLYRVPAAGGTPVTIREVPNRFLGSAEYSRDGSQLFWADSPMKACGTTAKGDVWIGNADGTGAANLTGTPTVYESGSTVGGGTPVPADVTAPAAPAIKAVGTVTATSATVGWTVADNDAVEYVVLRKPNGDPAPTSISDGTFVSRGPAKSATASGLTEGQAYDLYVFAVDSSGNVSGVSAAHPVRPTAPPVMRAGPRVGIGTTDATISPSWTGSAASYQILVGQRTKSSSGVWSAGPSYTTLIASTTATSTTHTGGQGRTYYFKARGFDEFGNATPYATPSVEHVPIDDSWGGFTYRGSWAGKTSATRFLGGYRTTITRGASIAARVDTARFVVIGDKCATCGTFEVWVDGVKRATVDTYSSTAKTRQVLYASGVFSSVKARSIKIVALGTSGRPRVSFDALRLQR